MKKILIINGPNLQLLGKREPGIYGRGTLEDIVAAVAERGRELGAQVDSFQSNTEDAIGKYDSIIINPAAYTHTSIVIRDAIAATGIPTIEVHLSDPDTREDFRRISFIRAACFASIKGRGFNSYLDALRLFAEGQS